MQDFLLYSLIASVVLTVLLNLLPLVFPRTSAKAEQKLQHAVQDAIEKSRQHEASAPPPHMRVFFPWKFVLILSVGLTLLVNILAYVARG